MRTRRGALLFIILFLLCGALIGGRFGRFPGHPSPIEDLSSDPSVRRFNQALNLIDEHYIDSPDKSRLTRAAVLGGRGLDLGIGGNRDGRGKEKDAGDDAHVCTHGR